MSATQIQMARQESFVKVGNNSSYCPLHGWWVLAGFLLGREHLPSSAMVCPLENHTYVRPLRRWPSLPPYVRPLPLLQMLKETLTSAVTCTIAVAVSDHDSFVFLQRLNHLVLMVMSDWLTAGVPIKEGWRCALMADGEQSMVTTGATLMQQWSANNLDTIYQPHVSPCV